MRFRSIRLPLAAMLAAACGDGPTAPLTTPQGPSFGDGPWRAPATCYKDATLTYEPNGLDRDIGCVEMSGDLSVDVGARNPIHCDAYSARGVKMPDADFGWALSQPVDGAQYMRTNDTHDVLLVGNTVTAGGNHPTPSCIGHRFTYLGETQRVTRSEEYRVEPAITISGQAEVLSRTTYRYTANVVGCVGACTYQWLRADWIPPTWRPTYLGTQPYQDITFTGPATYFKTFYLRVLVTTNGQTSEKMIVVTNNVR